MDEAPGTLDEVMDAALARLDGPIAGGVEERFEESVVAFARANYALRLENGRCTAGNVGECSGRYDDPNGMYVAPMPEAVLSYDNSPLDYAGSLPASFGTDLIDGARTVWYVIDGLPAQRAGLRVGDMVKSLNGQPAAEYDYSTWRSTTERPGQLRMAIERNGRPLEIIVETVIAVP